MLKPRFQKSALDSPQDFQKILGEWFQKVGKDYPWRQTADPYAILVSEVMLQQTRVAHVLNKQFYTRFLESFPDVNALAQAGDTELLKAWEGLGYYRRARMLRSTANAVVNDFGGIFPKEEEALLALPGIGPYTTAALLSFAFQKPSALVDGNVHRVLARLMDDASPIDSSSTRHKHMSWAHQLCDLTDPRSHHYAMMEIGQTLCRPGFPLCEICPIASFCKTQQPQDLPVKKKPVAITELHEYAVWYRSAEGKILIHQEMGKRRTGLWKLPLRTQAECTALQLIYTSSYGITRYRVQLRIYRTCDSTLCENDRWVMPEELKNYPMAAPFRKAIDQLITTY